MTLPGATEAGSAGKQPCRGIVRRSHRDDATGAAEHGSAPFPSFIGSVDPDALKIPARRAAYSLTENAPSPFPAEPGQEYHVGVGVPNWGFLVNASNEELCR